MVFLQILYFQESGKGFSKGVTASVIAEVLEKETDNYLHASDMLFKTGYGSIKTAGQGNLAEDDNSYIKKST